MAFSRYSLQGYNKASYFQLCVNMNSLNAVEDQLRNSLKLTDKPLTIVDYGSSEGYNSMIYFSKLLHNFRKYSNREISIIHTDLEENNWNLMCNLLNTSDESYLKLPNVYYSFIGKTFFEQLLPRESVHLGFSAFSFHYFSKKPVRMPGDLSFPHHGMTIQAKSDIDTLLTHRINELVKGGTISIILAGTGKVTNLNSGRLYYLPFVALVEKGIIRKEEIQNLEWNLHGLKLEEWNEILDNYKDKVEILKLELKKEISPYYTTFLQDGNAEKYKDDLAEYVSMLSKLQLFGILNRNNEEKERIFELFKEEVRKVINLTDEIYLEMITVILKKI